MSRFCSAPISDDGCQRNFHCGRLPKHEGEHFSQKFSDHLASYTHIPCKRDHCPHPPCPKFKKAGPLVFKPALIQNDLRYELYQFLRMRRGTNFLNLAENLISDLPKLEELLARIYQKGAV